MVREISNTAGIVTADSVLHSSVRHYFKTKKFTTKLGFFLISFLIHTCALYFIKFPRHYPFESDQPSLTVTLQLKEFDNGQSQTQPLNLQHTETTSKMTVPPSPNSYELFQQSERVIEQHLLLEKHRADMYQFGETNLDERSLTPDWLLSRGENSYGAFRIEEFQLNDGGTFVKLTYANGTTLCFEVPEADPFDVFNMVSWRFSRCKG